MQGPDGDAATLQWLKKNNPSIYAQVEAAQAKTPIGTKRKRPEFKPLFPQEHSDGEDPQQTGQEKDDKDDQAVGNEEDELSESEYEPDKEDGLNEESDEEEDDDLVDERGEGIDAMGSGAEAGERASGHCYGKPTRYACEVIQSG
jgi:hypothetical protein